VLFCFLLNVTNLLSDLLEAVLVIGVLKLQLCIADVVNKSAILAGSKYSNVTCLVAFSELVVGPWLRCEESSRMPQKFPETFL
jgi:hypothetical protein